MKYFILIFFLLILPLLNAEEQPLVTDRPDVTESSSTVPLGMVQLETGTLLENDQSNTIETQTLSLATTLVRYGLKENLELRFGTGYVIESLQDDAMDQTERSIDGLELGIKLFILEEFGLTPESAVILGADLPVGNQSTVGNNISATVIGAFSHTLSEMLGIGYNLGVDLNGGNFTGLYSLAAGIAMSKKAGCFLELFGSASGSAKPDVQFDGGITYLINPRFQLDISVGAAIVEKSPDWFVNGGFSVRIPQ